MSKVIQYTTIGGERWDNIALDFYGDAAMMNDIIRENPDVPLYDVLPPAIVLNIPIIQSAEIKVSAAMLPPWKQ